MKSNTFSLLSLSIPAMTAEQAKQRLFHLLDTPSPSLVFTPKTTMLGDLLRHPKRKVLFHRAALLLPDGIGILILSRLMGTPLPQRLTGIDMAETVLAEAEQRGLRVFLLGACPGVAREAAKRLWERYPRLCICGTHHGYFGQQTEEEGEVLALLKTAQPHILLVCMGYPKQESWLVHHRKEIPTLRLAMGLGGSFDVWAGKQKRAPKFMQAAGLEWLWRSVREPERLEAFAALPSLVRAAMVQKRLRSKRSS